MTDLYCTSGTSPPSRIAKLVFNGSRRTARRLGTQRAGVRS